ncbi:MAG: hypothetical protein HHAS10_03830 [Candidatus Altimarinota bacterium]
MTYFNSEIFEKLKNANSLKQLDDIIIEIYSYGCESGFSQGQACHIFLTAMRNENFNSYFKLWLNDKNVIKSKDEYKFLYLLLLCSGLAFNYLQNNLFLEHRKTLSIGLTEISELLGIDLMRLSFECTRIITNKDINLRKIYYSIFDKDLNKFLFRKSQLIVRIILLNLVQRKALVIAIRKLKKRMETNSVKIPYIFESIFGCLSEMSKCKNYANKEKLDLSKITYIFSDELVIMELLTLVTSGVQEYQEKFENKEKFLRLLDEMIENKINSLSSDEVWIKIDGIKKRLHLFSDTNQTQDYFTFCDKILIITIKWLIVVQNIQHAKDRIWKIRTFIRESYEWFSNLEGIINRYLNEDWESIEKLLQEENTRIEWKSSISTAIEIKMADGEFKKQNLKKIAETVISMMNSEGGNIIIGYIENYNKVRDDIKVDCYQKGKYHFYDIALDFERNKYSIDKFMRDIEDIIKNDLRVEIDEFSEFIYFEKLFLTDDKEKFIGNLTVKKAEKIFFSRGENLSVLLKKRMGRRNEYSDPLTEMFN